MPFDLGDAVPLTVSVTDIFDQPTNVDTITLTVTLPDGTTAVPTVSNPPLVTGTYEVDYSPVTAGRYRVRWTSSGPQSAHTDAFDVRDIAPPLLFSLSDAKATLNLSNHLHDDEVRDFIESTTAAVEFIVGPVVRQTVAEVHATGSMIVLRETPIISVQSIVPVLTSGTAYDVSLLDVDLGTGIILRLDGNAFVGPLRVTFTAGRTVTPSAIRDAGRIILKHIWSVQNGTMGLPSLHPFVDDVDARHDNTTQVTGLGFALPNRAIELLLPYAREPKVG
jgi:hypothetical protein